MTSEDEERLVDTPNEGEEQLVDTPPTCVAIIREEPYMIDCPKCGCRKPAHHVNTHICIDCSHAIDNRLTYYRQHSDWMAEAREQGLDVWLQQPGETQWEYTVWVAYRDSYPGKKPSYGDVAEQLQTTYSSVRGIAQRWSFQARMQVWMAECDRITMLQRRDEILSMNKQHIEMAASLRQKLAVAIDAIIPESLKPGEIASLMKMSAELERKARTDSVAQEEMRTALLSDQGSADLKKTQTKQGDLAEVVQILLKAGALGEITKIGIRETKTTEVALVDADDQVASLSRGDVEEDNE